MPVAPAVPSIVPEVGLLTVALLVLKLVVPSLTHSRQPAVWTAVGRLIVLAAGVPIDTMVVSPFVAAMVIGEVPAAVAVVVGTAVPLMVTTVVPDSDIPVPADSSVE